MEKLLPQALLTSALLLSAVASQAQVSFGPRVGLNASTINYKLKDSDDDVDKTKLLFGPQIGLALNAQFGNLAIQPAILFSMKGGKAEYSDSESGSSGGMQYSYSSKATLDTRLNYAEIPVNFVYSTNGADGGFQVFAGPYVAFGLSGKSKYKYTETYTINGRTETDSDSDEADVEFASKYGNGNKYYVRGLDAGLNFGVGYKVGGIQAQLGYGLGLGNLLPNDEDDKKPEDKLRNRNIQLSLSYFFE